jgi:hypothetical protein
VGDLGRLVAHDQEPGVCQPFDDRSRLLTALTLRNQLRQRDPPSGVLRRLAQLRESEEHLLHERLLLWAAAEEDLLGGVRDRPAHTPGREVARSGENTTLPASP